MADNLDTDLAIVEKDPATGEFKATAYFEDYLYKIITSLGGEGSTIIQDLVKVTVEADKLDYMFALVKQMLTDTAEFVGKIKNTNYTAENKDWVEARSGITISLPTDPLSNHQVIVSNGDGSKITVNGNGKNIKYSKTDTTLITKRKGTSLHFLFFIDSSETYWRVV